MYTVNKGDAQPAVNSTRVPTAPEKVRNVLNEIDLNTLLLLKLNKSDDTGNTYVKLGSLLNIVLEMISTHNSNNTSITEAQRILGENNKWDCYNVDIVNLNDFREEITININVTDRFSPSVDKDDLTDPLILTMYDKDTIYDDGKLHTFTLTKSDTIKDPYTYRVSDYTVIKDAIRQSHDVKFFITRTPVTEPLAICGDSNIIYGDDGTCIIRGNSNVNLGPSNVVDGNCNMVDGDNISVTGDFNKAVKPENSLEEEPTLVVTGNMNDIRATFGLFNGMNLSYNCGDNELAFPVILGMNIVSIGDNVISIGKNIQNNETGGIALGGFIEAGSKSICIGTELSNSNTVGCIIVGRCNDVSAGRDFEQPTTRKISNCKVIGNYNSVIADRAIVIGDMITTNSNGEIVTIDGYKYDISNGCVISPTGGVGLAPDILIYTKKYKRDVDGKWVQVSDKGALINTPLHVPELYIGDKRVAVNDAPIDYNGDDNPVISFKNGYNKVLIGDNPYTLKLELGYDGSEMKLVVINGGMNFTLPNTIINSDSIPPLQSNGYDVLKLYQIGTDVFIEHKFSKGD